MPKLGNYSGSQILAAVLAVAIIGYISWKISESAEQSLQFVFNGASVGAVYALLAMGFTIVYSTVWFFDLYYGAAAALGAYGVFYLRAKDALQVGQFDVNDMYVNVVFALVVAGVTGWALQVGLLQRLAKRVGRRGAIVAVALASAAAGIYAGFVLNDPDELNVILSPVVGALTGIAVFWLAKRVIEGGVSNRSQLPFLALSAIGAAAIGAYCGLLVAQAPGSSLYLSWGVSSLLAGAVGLALYRGLYMFMRRRARSPLIMLVASLGILLAITAFTTIIFQSAPRPLPEAFGSTPWRVAGANIKPFNVFTIGVAIGGFVALILLLKKTAFGKAVRAIGDDEEVSKVVGINTTVVIAIVFFIGAVYAALAGLLSGHDTAIQPRMGLLLLLKGWIASVVGGIGNMYGAIVGGFVLGLLEQFGIWDLAGEWKDAISFIFLILFLAFWPRGLIPRK
jgi:branched-chain amino acid transport system permease protein